MIKAVIFDWGGVIAPNPHGGWLNVLADMLGSTIEELLPHWQAAGDKRLSSGLITEEEFWLGFEKSYGKPLLIDKRRVWTEGSAIQPWPEVMSFVDSLRDRGIVTAVLSNTVKPLSAMLHEEALYDGFHTIVLSDEVGLSKPDPEIYKLILERLQLQPDECIFIDDLSKNLVPAQELGMKTILAKDPAQIIDEVTRALED